MSKRLADHFNELLRKLGRISALSRTLLIIGIVLVIMLSFYWDFGLQPFELKTIHTLDTGFVAISLAPEYLLALTSILIFYVGYRYYARRKQDKRARAKVSSVESFRELIGKFILIFCLGIIGLWYTYSLFSTEGIWSYHIPEVAETATGSFALQINALIALLLLLILVIEIHIRSEKGSSK